LQSMILPERGLHRVMFAIFRQAFNGSDLSAIGLHREQGARLQHFAVQVDGAGAALAGVTANLRARHIQLFAQKMDQ